MGEFSVWHLLIVLGIVLVIFGPSRLPGLGHSLGKAIRGFKSGMKGVEEEEEKQAQSAREALPHPEKDDLVNKDKNKNKNTQS